MSKKFYSAYRLLLQNMIYKYIFIQKSINLEKK